MESVARNACKYDRNDYRSAVGTTETLFPFSFLPQKRETEKARRLEKTQRHKDAESQSFFVSMSLCDSVSLIS